MDDSNKTQTKFAWKFLLGFSKTNIEFSMVEDEKKLFEKFFEIFQYYDPDLICNYSIHNSLNFLVERGKTLQINVVQKLSRVEFFQNNEFQQLNTTADNFRWKMKKGLLNTITGRVLIDFWRTIREGLLFFIFNCLFLILISVYFYFFN